MELYANEYKEVLEVIKHLDTNDFQKIPTKYINFLQENCNNNHNFVYDTFKHFSEQDMLEGTKLLLFELFEKFGATENQQFKIHQYKTMYINKEEKEKRRKYNPDDVFMKNIERNNNTAVIEKVEEQQLIIANKKESLWDKIKKFFKRR